MANDLILDYPLEGEALQALQTLFNYARGGDQTLTLPKVVNAGWVVLGFGCKVAAPGDIKSLAWPRVVVAGLHASSLDAEKALREELRKALAAHLMPAFGGGVVLKSIPWGQLVPIVVQVLEVLLSSQGG